MIQYLITALIDFVVGFIAISKKQNPAARAVGFAILCGGIWSLELFILSTVNDMDILVFLFHITRWGMFFAPSFFALLTWRLLGSRSQKFKNHIIIPSFIFSVTLSLGNLLVFPSSLIETNGGHLPAIDGIYYFFIAHFTFAFLGAIALVTLSYKTAASREKKRLKWLLFALLVWFLGGILLLFSMSQTFYLSKHIGSMANLVFVLFLFYATIQHNLMDFRLALSVGISRSILLAFFIWLYFIASSIVGDHTESLGGALTLLAFLAVMLETYPRLLRWILPNAKKILLKNSYEFRQTRLDTERALNDSTNFLEMKGVLDHLFSKIIRVKNYQIELVGSSVFKLNNNGKFSLSPFEYTEESSPITAYCSEQRGLCMADEMPEPLQIEMKKNNALLCFVVFNNEKALAVVFVGAPSDLSYYRYDDIKVFEWLISELGQVLNRLIRLDSMQNQLAEAKKTLSMLNLMNHYHHDIKAPFTIIDGVVSNDIYDKEKQKNIVLAQVERGSRLIATMAGILGGKHQRKVKSCSLETLVKDCLYIFEASIDRVDYNFAGLPIIKGDEDDLKILFINLIKNAVEARHASKDLHLTVKSWHESGNIYLSISDNGIGMTPSQLDNLWEPGFSSKERGNGIGMQAIQRIADEHNAKIDVSSQADNGSEFIICFAAAQTAMHTERSTGGDSNSDELGNNKEEEKRNSRI